eukprot:TRINITY_DN1948_c0_g2_i4.p1 TRINITY_DN1948_c0_g2~~TRINITY_DN1948_c0_g2_i4.p1  ORF type:complete len:1604 (+),score=411.16 TRINITY_DN1948_c0_g2_i4:311-5122(+)
MKYSSLLILSEINNVLGQMRLNARWASSANRMSAVYDENPLLRGFKSLRSRILQGDVSVDMGAVLSPFLTLIRSEETTGPVTGVALASLHRFVDCLLLLPAAVDIDDQQQQQQQAQDGLADGHDRQQRRQQAHNITSSSNSSIEPTAAADGGRWLGEIARAVAECRFEATDPVADEVVLGRILHVLHQCVVSPLAGALPSALLHQLLRTACSMSAQPRLSEVLRRQAQWTVQTMTLHVFRSMAAAASALPPLDVAGQHQQQAAGACESAGCGKRLTVPYTAEAATRVLELVCGLMRPPGTPPPPPASAPAVAPAAHTGNGSIGSGGIGAAAAAGGPGGAEAHNDGGETAQFAVQLVRRVLLEIPAHSMPASVHQLVRAEVCRQTLGWLWAESPPAVAAALGIVVELWAGWRHELRVELELLLAAAIGVPDRPHWASRDARVRYEVREIVLEFAGQLCAHEHVASELWLNYDCQPGSPDIFVLLSKQLVKHAFPLAAGCVYTSHVLALDALGLLLGQLVSRCCSQPSAAADVSNSLAAMQLNAVCSTSMPSSDVLSSTSAADIIRTHPQQKHLQQQQQPFGDKQHHHHQRQRLPTRREADELRSLKELSQRAIDEFNRGKHDQAFELLQQCQLLPTPATADDIAAWLRTAAGVSKQQLGEYIGRNKPFNGDVMRSYVSSFVLRAADPFVSGLRELLESFRIPGEAQVIGRILEAFAAHYWRSIGAAGPFLSQDAVEIIAFSAVLLNVDQHSPQVVNRMTFEQFVRNNRGIDLGGRSVPETLLRQIYDELRSNEIQLGEDLLARGLVSAAAWRPIMRRSRLEPALQPVTGGDYDAAVFGVIWGPMIAAAAAVLDVTADDAAQALVASRALELFTRTAQLAAHHHMFVVLDTVIITLCKFSGLEPPPWPSAGRLGASRKQRLAAEALFRLARDFRDFVRDAWAHLVAVTLSLHRAQLLPPLLEPSPLVDPTDATTDSPTSERARGSNPGTPEIRSGSGRSSLFGLLGSGSWFGDGQAAADDEAAVRAAQQAVGQWHVPDLFTGSHQLHPDSLRALLHGLVLASTPGSGPSHASFAAINLTSSSPEPPSLPAPPTAAGLASSASLVSIPPPVVPFEAPTAAVCVDLAATLLRRNLHRPFLLWPELAAHLVSLVRTAPVAAVQERSLAQLVVCATAVLSEIAHQSPRSASEAEDLQVAAVLGPLRDLLTDAPLSSSTVPAAHAALAVRLARGVAGLIGSVAVDAGVPLLLLAPSGVQFVADWLRWAAVRPPALPWALAVVEQHVVPPLPLGAERASVPVALQQEAGAAQSPTVLPSLQRYALWQGALDSIVELAAPAPEASAQALELQYQLYLLVSLCMLPSELLGATPSGLSDREPQAHSQIAAQVETVASDWWMAPIGQQWWHGVAQPTLAGVAIRCSDSRRDVAAHAWGCLQRALLWSPLDALPSDFHLRAFYQNVFPLLGSLLERGAGGSPDEARMLEEMRVRGVGLLCKAFLAWLPRLALAPPAQFLELWLTVLRFVEAFLSATQHSDLLAEAIGESLKNVLLVMHASGFIQAATPSSTSDSESLPTMANQLWEASWAAIDAFAPRLRSEFYSILGAGLPQQH